MDKQYVTINTNVFQRRVDYQKLYFRGRSMGHHILLYLKGGGPSSVVFKGREVFHSPKNIETMLFLLYLLVKINIMILHLVIYLKMCRSKPKTDGRPHVGS